VTLIRGGGWHKGNLKGDKRFKVRVMRTSMRIDPQQNTVAAGDRGLLWTIRNYKKGYAIGSLPERGVNSNIARGKWLTRPN